MAIKITSDSTCDLSRDLLEQHQLTLLPLYILKNGTAYRDGVELRPEDIFRHVESGGAITSTAAVNIADYHNCFAKFSPISEAVIHITISSDFSSCYQNACIAAQEFSNVYVVDSRSLSSGHGHVVLEAALAAERGCNAQEIVTMLNALTEKVEASFIIDRLDYMVKGGRCSSAAALGANLLKLKPCIEVISGKMQVVKKYRGSFEKCLQSYVQERLYHRSDLQLDRIFITHPACSPEVVELVRREIQKYASFRQIIETKAGCTVSSHCGPNTIGILFLRA
jgi:DegV family protein with EDD domain